MIKNMFASLALLACFLSTAVVQGFVVVTPHPTQTTALYFRLQNNNNINTKHSKALLEEKKKESSSPPFLPTYKITKLQSTTIPVQQQDKHHHHDHRTPIMKQVQKQAMGLLLRSYEMDLETFGVAL